MSADSNLTIERVLAILQELHVRYFCDQLGSAYAYFPWKVPGEHWECLPIRSRRFQQRLQGLVSEVNVRMPGALLHQTVRELMVQAEAGETVPLHNRVAMTDDGIHIDMGDALWRSIQVTREGYDLVTEYEPRFYRATHQQPLPEPDGGGDPWEILDFVPVEDESDGVLLLAWMAAAFYPKAPVPMLLFVGQQGAAKTTRCLRIRSLIDPSTVPVLGDVENRDLMQVFHHHAVPCFENVSYFARKQADTFCRAVTGNGVERRKLYTNADEVIFNFRRAILMNGIDIPSTRPDFLDRCLILPCKRVTEFHTMAQLDERFRQAKPRLLGAVLSLLVKTLSMLDDTTPSTNFRMADFAHFGRAVARALGKDPEMFDVAYRSNITYQSHELVEDDPFARALVEFAKGYDSDDPWRGSLMILLAEVARIARQKGISTTGRAWPKSPRWANTRLRELSPHLVSRGVFVEQLPRENDQRPWQIYYCRNNEQSFDTDIVTRSQ